MNLSLDPNLSLSPSLNLSLETFKCDRLVDDNQQVNASEFIPIDGGSFPTSLKFLSDQAYSFCHVCQILSFCLSDITNIRAFGSNFRVV